MSGHTNRNKRNGGNGGNPRSRRGPPRQRGADGRPGSQPKNDVPSAAEPEMQDGEQTPVKDHNRSARAPHPPTQSTPPTGPIGDTGPKQEPADDDGASLDEPVRPHDHQQPTRPRGRAPFAALSHGGHAYIPANGSRLAMNGQNGANGQNGHMPPDRRAEPPVVTRSMNDDAEWRSRLDTTRTVPPGISRRGGFFG
jgi:hypothetical protein